MAGDWIKMRTALQADMRVTRMARLLNGQDGFVRHLVPGGSIKPGDCNAQALQHFVVGALHRFWTAAQEITEDGSLAGMSVEDVDCMVGVKGFGAGLVAVGWLEEVPMVGLKIPNFMRHNGESAKKRAMAAERVQRHRSGKGACNAEALPEKRREEKRRGRRNPTTPQGGKGKPSPPDTGGRLQAFRDSLPESHLDDGLMDALGTWIEYRRQRRSPLTPLTITRQAAKLGRMSPLDAVASIERSIEAGWVGLFESKDNGTGKTSAEARREAKRAQEYPEDLSLPMAQYEGGAP